MEKIISAYVKLCNERMRQGFHGNLEVNLAADEWTRLADHMGYFLSPRIPDGFDSKTIRLNTLGSQIVFKKSIDQGVM